MRKKRVVQAGKCYHLIQKGLVPAVGAALFAGLWGARANAYED